jgi:hypothetical protein
VRVSIYVFSIILEDSMSEKMINRIIAAGVFVVTVCIYLKTLSTTVVFWDVGEYLASAFLLQVPHPPGAPLLLMVGHIFSMIPFSTDPAHRMHLISALSGAIVVTFLYLVSVKLFKRIRGTPTSVIDKMVVYGVSVIGALSLAFNASFWNNSIEFEAKGTAMFFVAFIMWLALRWSERADQPHNEKYLLLIAYLIGLCIGVRPLAVLAIFPVGLIVYFTKYQFERRSFIRFAIITALIFGGVYPGIVQFLPSFLNGTFQGMHNDIFPIIPLVLIIAAAYGVFRSVRTKQKVLHIACLSFLLVVLGYSTYFEVLMRANADNLPINENNPNNLSNFVSYISREQYGDVPWLKGASWDNEQQNYVEKLFPRRYSQEPMHEPTRVNYTSDGDFFWRYQVNHMYIRYLLWNYVGSDGDAQDSGVNASRTWAIPFLLGLLGLYYHFKRDWKMGLAFLSMFLLMGIIFALYQNQQEPQPRERDYFYAGSYFVFSLWIGMGVIAILDFIKKQFTGKRFYEIGTAGVLTLAVIAVPVNFVRINWFSHDRSQNYIAWDYSYNLLQSCEPNAILFTNGDNDTFPLWYLQDVEGVRTDIRVVNLSLVNTPWYIAQLKNSMPHGANKVPISLTDQQIERISPYRWTPQDVPLPVPKEVIQQYGVTDTSIINQGKISWRMAGQQYSQDVRFLRVQDIMVQDIVRANHWERPIYFAVTCSPDSKIGLDNYLWMEGLSMRLRPVKIGTADNGLDPKLMAANFLAKNVVPSKTPQHGYLYRNLDNPHVYYDENVQRMIMNYRGGFMRIADYFSRVENNKEKAHLALEQMEEALPLDVIPMQDWSYTYYVARIFNDLGDKERFEKYAKVVEERCLGLINAGTVEATDASRNPYLVMSEIYGMRKDYPKAKDMLSALAVQYPNTPWIKSQLDMYDKLQKGGAKPTTDSGKIQ